MNPTDTKEHFFNVIKSINKTCHAKCFDKEKAELNNNCGKICYEKYIYVISNFNKKLIKEGKKSNSEFVSRSYESNKDIIDETIFINNGSSPYNITNLFIYYETTIYPSEGKNEFKPSYFWR